jgi:hypothetical protein
MTAITVTKTASPMRRLLRLARPMRSQLLLAVLAGAVGCGCGVALLAVSGFLLARASQHPNIVAISVAVVMVRALSVGRCATSSACSPTTSRSASWPTCGWRSTAGWSAWPPRAWPRSGPATCSPG